MSELYKYSIKEIENLKDFFLVTYVIIDDLYQEITPEYIKARKNTNYSILSDSEIITISIVGELLSIDSEKAWFNFCKKNLMIYSQDFVIELDLTELVEIYILS